MNRMQRRQLKREQNKEVAKFKDQTDWINSLTPNQIAVIEHMMRDLQHDTEMNCIADVDKILTGTLLEMTDMTWEESYKFNVQFGKYYAEYKMAVSKEGREERLKVLIELEKEIVGKVENWIKAGKSRTEVIKQLRKDYKGVGITTPELNNVYGRTLSEYKKHIEEYEGKIKSTIKKHLKKDKDNQKILEILEQEYTRIGRKEFEEILAAVKKDFMESEVMGIVDIESKTKYKKNEGEVEMSSLKVLKKTIELEGECGKYLIDETGVTREDKHFKDLEEVEAYKKAELEKFEKEIAELKAVFEYK